jgi:transcriptional regulator with XRE-family HTH domain
MRRSSTGLIHRIIGLRMRAIRLERGLTLEELGETLGISPAEITRYEEGLVSIHAARLKTFAVALDCSMDAFFKHKIAPAADAAALIRERLS